MPKKNKRSSNNSRRRKSRSILIGSIIAIFIAITPYIFYTYKSFPSGNTFDFYFFVYESKYQESITTVMWLFMAKFIPLLLLIFWFFTCKHWWYHVILIPMAMFAFQIISLLYEDRYLDEVEIYWLLPIMMITIPFVYFIRVKLFDKHVLGIDLEEMEKELHNYRKNDKNKIIDEQEEEGDEEKETEQELSFKYQSFSDYLNSTFSTDNIHRNFRRFQNNLKGWMHLKS
jgi:magnesium-transporting ATPase (P-type)